MVGDQLVQGRFGLVEGPVGVKVEGPELKQRIRVAGVAGMGLEERFVGRAGLVVPDGVLRQGG